MVTLWRERRLFIMLMIFWIVLAGEITTRQLVTGMLGSALSIWMYAWILSNTGADRVRWISTRLMLRFGFILISEIFKSAGQHLLRIVKGHSATAVSRLQLEVKEELVITLIANAITLTPGTVTLEVDKQRISVLHYGLYPNQCPLDLITMVDRLQKPFQPIKSPSGGNGI